MAQREGALIRSMIALRGDRKTGLLHVDANGVRTSMHLQEGIIVHADETPSAEPLGRLLVRCGLLTAQRYTEVLEKMAGAALVCTDPDHLRFGEVSVECGFLTSEQLTKALGDHVRMRVIRAFHREDHEWRFEEGRAGFNSGPRIEIGIEPVVLLAARTFRDMPDRELVPAASMHRVPLLVDDIAVITQRFELKPGERAFVETIDGTKRVCDLIPASTPNAIRMHQSAILAALLWTRAAKLADKSHMPSVRAPALEPAPIADPPSSRSLLAAAAVAPSSSSVMAVAPKNDAPVAPARITHEARLNAELSFQKGRTHFGAGRTEEALHDFRQAQKLDPASHEYALYTGWLEAGAGKKEIDYAHRLSLKRDALALQRSNATMAFPLYVIGHIAMLEGSHTDAKRWLEQARALDPDMRDAEGALRALARKVSATSSDPMEGSAASKKSGTGDKSEKSTSPAASSGLLGRVSGWLGRKNDLSET